MSEINLYFDEKGRKIPTLDLPIFENGDCHPSVGFCCVAPVPEGFEIAALDPSLAHVCVDVSGVSCTVERQEVHATVDNPCNGEIHVPVMLQAVRMVGCIRMLASAGPVSPISPAPTPTPTATPMPTPTPTSTPIIHPSGSQCTVSCAQTVCINEVVGYLDDEEYMECMDCYEVRGSEFDLSLTYNACGHQEVLIMGRMYFEFTECDECDC